MGVIMVSGLRALVVMAGGNFVLNDVASWNLLFTFSYVTLNKCPSKMCMRLCNILFSMIKLYCICVCFLSFYIISPNSSPPP